MDITLALGGGGAKGIAHIGVIRRLENEGFRIRAIAGTSAGGLIGAVYAAGYSTQAIEEILSELDQNHMFRRTNQDGPSLLGLAGITQLLVNVLGDRTFDSLHIPFSCTAVDTLTSQEIILSQGCVVDAVLATIAVPGIFPPRHYKDTILVDGGVMDPVPVALARRSFPNLPVFAVVLSPPPEKWRDLPSASLPLQNPLVDQFSKLRLAQAFHIFMQSVDISGRMMAELRLQVDQPDLIIRPNVSKIGLLDKVNVHEMVLYGQAAVDYILPEIHQKFNWKRRTVDKFRNIFNKS